MPSALVASAGIPYVDENDIGNLTAEMMLKYVSGQQVMFLEHYDHHPEWILLGEDGYIPDEFIDGKPQIKVVTIGRAGRPRARLEAEDGPHDPRLPRRGRRGLPHAHRDRGGEDPSAVGRDGRARCPPWPSVKFFPDATVRSILDHVQSQHFAMTYGNWVEELHRPLPAAGHQGDPGRLTESARARGAQLRED